MAKRKNRTCMNRLKKCKPWEDGSIDKKAISGRILSDARTPMNREKVVLIGKNGRPLKKPRITTFLYGYRVKQFHATKGPRQFLQFVGGA